MKESTAPGVYQDPGQTIHIVGRDHPRPDLILGLHCKYQTLPEHRPTGESP